MTADDVRMDEDSSDSDEDVDSAKPKFQFWAGKDYYNPFVKDFIALHEPYEGEFSMICDFSNLCNRHRPIDQRRTPSNAMA